MKKIISLVLVVVTFIAFITFLVLFGRTQQIDLAINSQENINKIKLVNDANNEFKKIAEELLELYDSDYITQNSLEEVTSSLTKLEKLENLSKIIADNMPIVVPLGNTSNMTIAETSHGQVVDDLYNWQIDTMNNINWINDGDFKTFAIESKETNYDSKYRSKVEGAISMPFGSVSSDVLDVGIEKSIENMGITQMSDEYLVAFIGYAIIFGVSLLIFICCKNRKGKGLIIIDLIIVVIFSIFTVLNIAGEFVYNNKSNEIQVQNNVGDSIDSNEEQNTERSTPISEWGFNNLYELGYGLVQITGYNLDEGYVYYADKYEGNIFKLENGYYITQIINTEENSIYSGYTTNYEVVNNDSILLSGDGTFTVDEKETIGDGLIVFVSENGGYLIQNYVPYSLIDWDRGVQSYVADNDEQYEYSYKLYLKKNN